MISPKSITVACSPNSCGRKCGRFLATTAFPSVIFFSHGTSKTIFLLQTLQICLIFYSYFVFIHLSIDWLVLQFSLLQVSLIRFWLIWHSFCLSEHHDSDLTSWFMSQMRPRVPGSEFQGLCSKLLLDSYLELSPFVFLMKTNLLKFINFMLV